jgi:hypothetical protein
VVLAGERASTEHLRGREVRGGAPGEEGQSAHVLAVGFSASPALLQAQEQSWGLGSWDPWRDCASARCAAGIAGMVRRLRGGAVGLCTGCCAGEWEEERGERG